MMGFIAVSTFCKNLKIVDGGAILDPPKTQNRVKVNLFKEAFEFLCKLK